MINSNQIKIAATWITFFTGLTGLVYEVTWHRYLANLLGSAAQATALILAVFLGGLSIGYAAFGKISRNRTAKFLVITCGIAEVAIGVWAIIFPSFFDFAWKSLGILNSSSQISFFTDFLIAIALIGPPTILMGGTLPLLTQGLSKDLSDAPKLHARIYAVNTGGAFLGSLIAGFVMLPLFGLPLTLFFAACINLLAGLALILIAKGSNNDVSRFDNAEAAPAPRNWRSIVVATLAGFYAISLQTVFMRLFGISVGSSEYSFCVIVAIFILMLALGAARLSKEDTNIPELWRNQLLIAIGGIIVYLLGQYGPYGAHVVRTVFSNTPLAFYVYYLVLFIMCGVFLAIPVGAMGSTMPILFSTLESKYGELGALVGRLYSYNTLGCVLGALIGGFLILFYLDLDQVFQLCMVLVILSAILSLEWSKKVQQKSRVTAILVIVALAIPFLPLWNKSYLSSGLFRTRQLTEYSYRGPTAMHNWYQRAGRIIAYKDDPNTTVSVREDPIDSEEARKSTGYNYDRSILVNGKSDGATLGKDLNTTRLVAHLPALMNSSSSKDVAIIGFGTGITVGSMAQYQDIDSIAVVEISPYIKRFAPLFDFANGGMTQSSKVKWFLGDAYRVLGSSPNQFGVIVSEPSNPWVTGVERLFTREFYELVKNRLAPGGVYTQWIHSYLMSEPTVGIVLNTFSRSFPHVRVFRAETDFILVGSMAPATIHFERMKEPAASSDLATIGIKSPQDLLSHEFFIHPPLFLEAGIQTLEFPKLSFASAKDFFLGRDVALDELTATYFRRPWYNARMVTSFSADWMREHPKDLTLMESAAKTICEIRQAEFFPAWELTHKNCRDALMAFAVLGSGAPGYGIESSDLKLLKMLTDSSIPLTQLNAADSKRAVQLYSDFQSIYLPIDTERVLSSTKTCQDDLTCGTDLIEGLVFANDVGNAEKLLSAMQLQMEKSTSNRIRQLILESKKASQQVRTSQ